MLDLSSYFSLNKRPGSLMKMLKSVKRLRFRKVKSPHNTSSFLIQQHNLLQSSIESSSNFEEMIDVGGSMIDIMNFMHDTVEDEKVAVTRQTNNYCR